MLPHNLVSLSNMDLYSILQPSETNCHPLVLSEKQRDRESEEERERWEERGEESERMGESEEERGRERESERVRERTLGVKYLMSILNKKKQIAASAAIASAAIRSVEVHSLTSRHDATPRQQNCVERNKRRLVIILSR